MAQHTIGAPLLRQFDDAARQIATILFEFCFEAAEQGESVGGRAGKTGNDFVVVETAELARAALENFTAGGNLAVAGENYFAVAAYAKDRCRTDFSSHECLSGALKWNFHLIIAGRRSWNAEDRSQE